MTTEALMAQVKGMEAQLTVLKARLREASLPTLPRSFADLEGILEGKAESTEKDIDATEYRVTWDDGSGAGE